MCAGQSHLPWCVVQIFVIVARLRNGVSCITCIKVNSTGRLKWCAQRNPYVYLHELLAVCGVHLYKSRIQYYLNVHSTIEAPCTRPVTNSAKLITTTYILVYVWWIKWLSKSVFYWPSISIRTSENSTGYIHGELPPYEMSLDIPNTTGWHWVGLLLHRIYHKGGSLTPPVMITASYVFSWM